MGLGVCFVIDSHDQIAADMNISLGVMLGVYTAGVRIFPSSHLRVLTENRSAVLI